jgi:heat shock protein HslJ
MKALVGFLFFMLFFAGFAFVMLQGRQLAQQNLPAGGSGLVGVKWRPDYVGAELMPKDSGMFVQFAVDGGIKGHGGCNAFFGSMERTEAGISIGPLGATRMACPEPAMGRETAFMNALQDARGFEVDGGRLQLLDGDNRLLVELVGEQ